MSFAVSKSAPVMVRPSTEPVLVPGKTTATQVVQLSSWDTAYVDFQVTLLLVFDGSVHQPVEAIKKGLSRALAHYHTIAGRLAAAADEDDVLLHVACTGEGVPFVAASAGCALQDDGLLDAPFSTSLLDDLAVYYPAPEGCRSTDPMLLMQVTEFACGGFTVGVAWNHTLADATGIAQFLQAVGELTRAESDASVPSVTPVRDGRAVSLPLLSPPVIAAKQSLMLDHGGQGIIYLDIIVPLKLIDRIKSDYKAAHSGDAGYCTTFEATAAMLWRCRTRAIIGDDPDGYDMSTPAPLAFIVNVRKHVDVAAGYYGNCAVAQLAFATTREVAGAGDNDGMNSLVDLIKRAKEGVPDLLRGMRAGGGAVDGMGEEEIAAAFGYNALMVTSWRNIRFDDADFGGGAPARVVGRWQQSTLPCVALLSCGATGERLLAQCVRAEHAAALVAELDQLARA